MVRTVRVRLTPQSNFENGYILSNRPENFLILHCNLDERFMTLNGHKKLLDLDIEHSMVSISLDQARRFALEDSVVYTVYMVVDFMAINSRVVKDYKRTVMTALELEEAHRRFAASLRATMEMVRPLTQKELAILDFLLPIQKEIMRRASSARRNCKGLPYEKEASRLLRECRSLAIGDKVNFEKALEVYHQLEKMASNA